MIGIVILFIIKIQSKIRNSCRKQQHIGTHKHDFIHILHIYQNYEFVDLIDFITLHVTQHGCMLSKVCDCRQSILSAVILLVTFPSLIS